MALKPIKKSSVSKVKGNSTLVHSNKHQRFKLDVQGKYCLLGPNDDYSLVLETYSEILGYEVTDITKLSRKEAVTILQRIGGKLI
jgi:hypothetical protein